MVSTDLLYDRARLIREKWSRLGSAMKSAGMDALVVNNQYNVTYITGFSITYGRNHQFSLFVGEKEFAALFGLAYFESWARRRCNWLGGVYPQPDTPQKFAELVGSCLKTAGVGTGGTIGYDSSISHLLLVDLIKKFGSSSLVQGDSVLDRARSVKTPIELELMKRSAKVSCLGMAAAARGIKSGTTELEIAAAAEYAMRRNGASEIAFPSIVMSGARAALNEEVATTKRIRTGETVVVDQGCVYDDYSTEFARTFIVGEPSEEQTRAYRADQRSLTQAAKAIKPGVTAGEIDLIARNTLEEEGFGPYQHPYITGHGEGLASAEFPLIGPGAQERLEEGMVIALEPTIFKKSVGAVRLENVFLVKAGGAENLTQTPFLLSE